MSQFVRVKDPATGHDINVSEARAKRLKLTGSKDAYDKAGGLRPAKPKATPSTPAKTEKKEG